MLAPQEVQRMLALSALGWGAKRISRELGCSRNTVREHLRRGRLAGRWTWRPAPARWATPPVAGRATAAPAPRQRDVGAPGSGARARHPGQPAHRAARGGTAAPELRAGLWPPLRYETPPGQQLQIDFGSTAWRSGEESTHPPVRRHAGLQPSLLRGGVPARTAVGLAAGAGRAFRHFGGVPQELLLDNARRWSPSTTPRPARSGSTTVSTPSAATGASRHGPARVPACTKAGRTRRGLRQAQRHRRPPLRQHRGAARPWRTGPARSPTPGARHHRRAADPALQSMRSPAAAADQAPFLQVRELTRRAHRRLHRAGHQPLQRAVEAHRRERHVVVAERQVRVLYAGREVACPRAEPTAAGHRDRPASPGRHRRGEHGGRELAARTRRNRRSSRLSCCARWSSTSKPWEGPGDGDAKRPSWSRTWTLEPMLTRLKLTAIRDQLDTLLDQAGRAELNLREALAMLCTAEVGTQGRAAHPDGHVDRQVPLRAYAGASSTTRSPRWTPSRSANWPPRAGWPTATACCCWGPRRGQDAPGGGAGREAIVRGYSTLFVPATSLVTPVGRGARRRRLERKLLHFTTKLLIVDDDSATRRSGPTPRTSVLPTGQQAI